MLSVGRQPEKLKGINAVLLLLVIEADLGCEPAPHRCSSGPPFTSPENDTCPSVHMGTCLWDPYPCLSLLLQIPFGNQTPHLKVPTCAQLTAHASFSWGCLSSVRCSHLVGTLLTRERHFDMQRGRENVTRGQEAPR